MHQLIVVLPLYLYSLGCSQTMCACSPSPIWPCVRASPHPSGIIYPLHHAQLMHHLCQFSHLHSPPLQAAVQPCKRTALKQHAAEKAAHPLTLCLSSTFSGCSQTMRACSLLWSRVPLRRQQAKGRRGQQQASGWMWRAWPSRSKRWGRRGSSRR